MPTDAEFIEKAKKQYESDGTLEIDDNPVVSRGEDSATGAYVAAWVWVEVEQEEEDSWAG